MAKQKLKTNRGAAKRFRVRGDGTFKAYSSHRRHLLTSKSTKRKRHLRGVLTVHPCDQAEVRQMLPHH